MIPIIKFIKSRSQTNGMKAAARSLDMIIAATLSNIVLQFNTLNHQDSSFLGQSGSRLSRFYHIFYFCELLIDCKFNKFFVIFKH